MWLARNQRIQIHIMHFDSVLNKNLGDLHLFLIPDFPYVVSNLILKKSEGSHENRESRDRRNEPQG